MLLNKTTHCFYCRNGKMQSKGVLYGDTQVKLIISTCDSCTARKIINGEMTTRQQFNSYGAWISQYFFPDGRIVRY